MLSKFVLGTQVERMTRPVTGWGDQGCDRMAVLQERLSKAVSEMLSEAFRQQQNAMAQQVECMVAAIQQNKVSSFPF